MLWINKARVPLENTAIITQISLSITKLYSKDRKMAKV
jgi:hypothetical protein